MQSKNCTGLIIIIEELVKSNVYQNYPSNWDEGFISRSLFKSFQSNLNDMTVNGFKKSLTIGWSAYKAKAADGDSFCDAAVLVKVHHKDQPPIEGAALLETRKRTANRITFDEMKWKRLGKVQRNSRFSQLLLYDYEDIGSFSSNLVLQMPPFGYGSLRDRILVSPFTNAAVTSTDMAVARKANDSSLYRFSLPFSNQLVMRYIHGFDLDFSPKTISVAKGNENPLGFPKTLLCINVAEENTVDSEYIEINKALWGAIN
jgi:hypothetical protein